MSKYNKAIIESSELSNFEELKIFDKSERINTNVVRGKLEKDSNPPPIIKNLLKTEHIPYLVLIYNVNNVSFEKLEKISDLDRFKIERKYLEEIRIFSLLSELYIWKKNKQLFYRFREDGNGSELLDYFEEAHIMWGTRIEKENILSEEFRGMKLKMPFEIKETSKLPLRYVVRNYIDYDKNGFLQFIDARLLRLIDKNGNDVF